MKMNYPYGATPLDRDEINGLKPGHITTQGELNEVEAANIARLMANILLKQHNQKTLTWGATTLSKDTDTRKEYIQALREADKNNFAPLIAFATS
ncbi:MAG: hypothetical protein Q7T03_05435 [Deltaproteobacteria bacterium]|nr:hypothetical protein [Deltaproteobacteria bacterium]